jgi:3-dehydroquinate synthase
VTDLTGFAASTWLRGVDYCASPTTLLAMVDASIGGKNGIDFRSYKNLIGTFLQSRFVLCDVSLLSTLSPVEFSSGMAEVIKHAILDGESYFGLAEEMHPSDAAADVEWLRGIVAGSHRVKMEIVAADEREKGTRRLLNLGHTFGHAVESISGLPHGHSVAAGIATACRFSVTRGSLSIRVAKRIFDLLDRWGLPSSLESAAHLSPLLGGRAFTDVSEMRAAASAALAADKKRTGSMLHFVLPEGIGSVRIEKVALETLQAFIREVP